MSTQLELVILGSLKAMIDMIMSLHQTQFLSVVQAALDSAISQAEANLAAK